MPYHVLISIAFEPPYLPPYRLTPSAHKPNQGKFVSLLGEPGPTQGTTHDHNLFGYLRKSYSAVNPAHLSNPSYPALGSPVRLRLGLPYGISLVSTEYP